MRARWLVLAFVVLALVLGTASYVANRPDPALLGDPVAPTSPTAGEDDAEDEPVAATDLAVAESETREDSYYPEVGDPGVDSLRHSLDLSWDPQTRVLSGVDTFTFRAVADAESFQLDLGEPLEVSSVTLDGAQVTSEHDDKDLVVEADLEADRTYEAVIAYEGTPEAVLAPTTRGDVENLGWTITPEGGVWTMQEPYGAFTWYPVNDQPADKALYDFTISVPEPWVGVANGTLESREVVDGRTVTEFSMAEPASSYLTTIAIGDYVHETDETDSGIPLNYWVPSDDADVLLPKVRRTKEALEWAEEKLGPYPFESAGTLVVPSQSGMETQTLITMGATEYALSAPVLAHEMVHHWYGDTVSPTDWRDVWMNEGMTMYLQGIYEAEHGGPTLEETIDGYAASDATYRELAGPPGAYDRDKFAEGNIYYLPAIMWHELRARIGDEAFWSMVRAWPVEQRNSGATRQEYLDWVEETTGEELTAFFDAWLLGETTPARATSSD